MKTTIYRWALKKLRLLVDAADEWLHAREVQFQTARMELEAKGPGEGRFRAEVDVKASAAREKAIRKSRAARPRLRYQAGQFVRVTSH
jgi:hypothetical protein